MSFLRVFINFIFVLCLSVSSTAVHGENLQQVKASLLKDIQQAQHKLAKKEREIAKASENLSHNLYELEQQVLKLRDKTAVKRRLLDDKTLALSELKQRLKLWQQQDNYQKRLLLELADNVGLETAKQQEIMQQPLLGFELAKSHLQQLQADLSPNWQQKKVVFPGGEVEDTQVLSLGPIRTFWFEEGGIAGLLNQQQKVEFLLSPAHTEALKSLFKNGEGVIRFDPSLGKALAMAQQQDSLLQHIQRGGIWVLPILAFACFALLIALFKAWQLWRLPKLMPMLVEKLDTLAKYPDVAERLHKLIAELQGAQKALLEICLNTKDPEARDDRLLAYMLELKHKLSAFMGAIAVTAAIAPLLGLLGTVSGMIETFNMMSLFGAGDPAVVSGGISKALITTELGLVVAIPALVMHALLNRSANQYTGQLNNTAIRLSKLEVETRV